MSVMKEYDILSGNIFITSVEDGGEIHTPETGIPRGCALSPLLAGSLLYHIDADFNATEDIYYARYMDDFILLTQTRW
ncbi:reverse transcriptase domain-containing protein [Escherichia coli]|uniref:reverse transcriptase domain-containing protein n=1 Tax=Escherichia coli TaxID=562 RepID=UPI002FCAD4D6